MTEINWSNFQSKFNGRERAAFEQLAYMLFCHEFDRRIGVFRFKNQTGIETEPVAMEGVVTGFQAKYFETSVGENKTDIIDSIRKAKSKNPTLDKILLYVNRELSESRSKLKKKPSYQTDIEEAASAVSVEIEWRVPSHFEIQLSAPENEYLAHHFFSLGLGETDFLGRLLKHSEDILFTIQTAIHFDGKQIRLDRGECLSKINQNDSHVIILAGEGGSGKTALIKELMRASATPCYVLRAAEFNRPGVDSVFKEFGPFGLADFLRMHEREHKKIFVVDSAEKLADLPSVDFFREFLSALIQDGWTIIFTTRNSYLDDLSFQMVGVYQRPFDVIRLENLSDQELETLSVTHGFNLPGNARLRSLISNLFYLKEYLGNYEEMGREIDVARFRYVLWLKKIQDSKYRKDNTHLAREQGFLSLAKERCSTGNFILRGKDCDARILSLLEADEIIKSESAPIGYFITHDIYEEWALEKLVETEYGMLVSHDSFFANIGESLPIRRAFRAWLSEKIFQADADVKYFVEQAFVIDEVPAFWKDEVLVSVLLSDYCAVFFARFNDTLLANDKALLKRVVFLLRTACKEVDTDLHRLLQAGQDSDISPEHVFTKPKGKGWETTIAFMHHNLKLVKKDELDILVPFLNDWVSSNRQGETARLAGLFALHFYKDAELGENTDYNSETEKSLLQLVLLAVPELQEELLAVTDDLLTGSSRYRHKPFDGLQEAVLKNTTSGFAFTSMLPTRTIQLADKAWYAHKEKIDEDDYYSGVGIEERYSINPRWHHDYFPASALQTPVLGLLRFAFPEAINFILDFTNRTVEAYFASGFDPTVKEIEVTILGEKKRQIISGGLWAMYRGSGSPVTPYLLQSIHMALEKRLLEIAEKAEKKIVESWLLHLLENTRSASITAVVASVVLAYPDDFFKVAKILFSVPEFFWCDGRRLLSESEAKSIYAIGRGFDYRTRHFENERIATCDDPHRRLSLENLALNYQFFKNEKVSDEEGETRQHEIWNILDSLGSTISAQGLDDNEQKKLRLLLARMDRRKMNPKVTNRDDNSFVIEFNPELDNDLNEFSQHGQASFEDTYKHLALKHWAMAKTEGRELGGDYRRYDDNPELVLEETKTILDGLRQGDEHFFLLNSSTPAYACSALVKHYRDHLTAESLAFCVDVIVSFAQAPLREGYQYQIGDGVEVALSTLPSLYTLFPHEKPGLNNLFLLVLFDTQWIGAYKRVCDYAIEALREVFKISPADANAILFGCMLLKPKFDADNPSGRWMTERKSRAEILEEFVAKYSVELEAVGNAKIRYHGIDFASQNLTTAETAFQIIPADTEDARHIDYVQKLLQKFSNTFLKETRYSRDDDPEADYRLKHRFFKAFAAFLLHRDVATIPDWTKPVIDAFGITQETANLLSEVVSAEDHMGKYESFWAAWQCFYPMIKEWSQKSRHHQLDEIISNYLLAWQWWKETAKEWRSLRADNLPFFQKVCAEMGRHPVVLYSISKLLNEIGSPFLNDGIFWIADILSQNKTVRREALQPNTVYYLERLARRHVYLNRSKLKTNRLLRSKLLVLLDFLFEKGSVSGYLLREDVL